MKSLFIVLSFLASLPGFAQTEPRGLNPYKASSYFSFVTSFGTTNQVINSPVLTIPTTPSASIVPEQLSVTPQPNYGTRIRFEGGNDPGLFFAFGVSVYNANWSNSIFGDNLGFDISMGLNRRISPRLTLRPELLYSFNVTTFRYSNTPMIAVTERTNVLTPSLGLQYHFSHSFSLQLTSGFTATYSGDVSLRTNEAGFIKPSSSIDYQGAFVTFGVVFRAARLDFVPPRIQKPAKVKPPEEDKPNKSRKLRQWLRHPFRD